MKYIQVVLLMLVGFSTLAEERSGVDISIVKSGDNFWKLIYQMDRPASRIGFVRNPDASRVERWEPLSLEFEIVSIDGYEYLARKDGASFDRVEISLTPTYKHLKKDYAPFSPYSNGGNLIYTGRLFACIEACSDDVQSWKLSMQIPEGEHMIVNGQVYTGSTNWVDRESGMNIYVGTQKPIEGSSFIAVIDGGLPDKIRNSLNSDIPKMINYFGGRLGENTVGKPTLYASYAQVDGSDRQGGTLPNQIFMHWNLNDMDKRLEDPSFVSDIIWFFAHEVAHFHQEGKEEVLSNDVSESWLHEGNADWLAASALIDLYPDLEEYVYSKIDKYKVSCSEGLKEFPLVEAANHGRFDLYYSCGLLIHRAIDQSLQEKSNGSLNLFSLWKSYRETIEGGGEKGSDSFLNMVEDRTSRDFVEVIRQLINSKLVNPEATLDKLSETI
ncbi:hypothetical protein [Microbulbifer sp. A4B17]|uniref:hypothetical protein n=1 Tax=Microbulbifer sp. A4B17 TaxID=359370 RepID=UPI001300829A|nr:hypothetical protein [Microbulbifer sp. A4B17]